MQHSSRLLSCLRCQAVAQFDDQVVHLFVFAGGKTPHHPHQVAAQTALMECGANQWLHALQANQPTAWLVVTCYQMEDGVFTKCSHFLFTVHSAIYAGESFFCKRKIIFSVVFLAVFEHTGTSAKGTANVCFMQALSYCENIR